MRGHASGQRGLDAHVCTGIHAFMSGKAMKPLSRSARETARELTESSIRSCSGPSAGGAGENHAIPDSRRALGRQHLAAHFRKTPPSCHAIAILPAQGSFDVAGPPCSSRWMGRALRIAEMLFGSGVPLCCPGTSCFCERTLRMCTSRRQTRIAMGAGRRAPGRCSAADHRRRGHDRLRSDIARATLLPGHPSVS